MAGHEHAARPIDAIISFLRQKGWSAELDVASKTFSIQFDRKTHAETFHFVLFKEETEFAFYIVPDFALPPELHSDVAEYVNRVNLGLRIGNFEFDYGEGKIRFKSSLSFAGNGLTPALVSAAVETGLKAWKAYLPGAVDVISGEHTPVSALNRIDYQD
jgi:hypothetical protein